jgi:hypothetical protein
MTFLKRLKAFCLAVLIAATPFTIWAGDGHDHGEAPTALGGPALPRFTAVSETFELVGVLNGKQLTLYLDRTADNSPVKGAKLELELGGVKVDVKPHGEGEFEATLAQELKPGEITVSATVIAGQETDLLAGDLDLHGESHAGEATPNPIWKAYGAWSLGGLFALALLTLTLRRVRANRFNRAGGVA